MTEDIAGGGKGEMLGAYDSSKGWQVGVCGREETEAKPHSVYRFKRRSVSSAVRVSYSCPSCVACKDNFSSIDHPTDDGVRARDLSTGVIFRLLKISVT